MGQDRRSHFIIITAKAAGAFLFICAVAVATGQLHGVRSEHGAVRNHVLQNRLGFSQPHILGKETALCSEAAAAAAASPVMERGDGER